MDRNLCIIPARGGSKRIPKKNIKNFLEKPIIAYSIEVAQRSKLFDEVMVSTDDEEIAGIAEEHGACVPFMRSELTSGDIAPLWKVEKEVLDNYQTTGKTFDFVCCLLATSPLTTVSLLREGLEKLRSGGFDNIRPVARFSYPVQRGVVLNGNEIKMLYPEHRFTRSQDLEPVYHDAGQFYWSTSKEGLLGEKRGGFIIPETNVQDIDTMEDWKLAELKYKLLSNG